MADALTERVQMEIGKLVMANLNLLLQAEILQAQLEAIRNGDKSRDTIEGAKPA